MDTFRILNTHAADWDVDFRNNAIVITPREDREDVCQLCGRHGLVHTYPILNRSQNLMMYVGSECVRTWVESVYEMPYGRFFGELMQKNFKPWVDDFFGQYRRLNDKYDTTKPQRDLAHTIYECVGEELTSRQLKKIYSSALKLGFRIPSVVYKYWRV